MELQTIFFVSDMLHTPMKIPTEWSRTVIFLYVFPVCNSVDDYITDGITDII